MWFKKNLLVLIIGAVIGSVVAVAIGYPIHLNSKRIQNKANEKVLSEKNKLIKDCINRSTATYTNNNEFNPNIGKNKKGVIEIKTFPEIKQLQKMELPLSTGEIVKQTIQIPSKPPDKPRATKQRRGKGSW